MPCHVKILTTKDLVDAPYTGESLNDTAQYEPSDGVYTITNTFHRTQVLMLEAHLDRLEDSARRASIPLRLDRVRLRYALRHMIEEAKWGDVRFRITVSKAKPDELTLAIEPFTPLSEDLITHGTHCITAVNSARTNPEAKTTDWMHYRTTLQNAMPAGIYDTFLCDEKGFLLEGLASNFYGIMDGVLRTADAGILKGISRQVVLEVAPSILAVDFLPIHISQLSRLQEAFLSSSSRGIVPVVSIDGLPIADGQVGTRTRALREAYAQWLRQHLQEL